jgi:LysR family transcriptional regulator, glycine cleavage system transcriptional activator
MAMSQLPLGALRAFESAARTGSFRAAAGELALTPSAVSHAIRGFENQIGATLFEREGRNVRLTSAGEALLRSVRGAFDELRRGLEVVDGRSTNLLRLHCAPSLAAQWLMPRLRNLTQSHKGLEVRLAAGTNYPQFRNDEFDADICYGPPRQEGLITVPLGEEVVCPMCSPQLAGKIREPADLLKLQLIESEMKRVRWTAWFAANGLSASAPGGYRFDRSFMAIAAACDGLGVTLESTRLAERELQSGRLVIPLAGRSNDVTYVGHYLVYPPLAKHRKTVRIFRDWITQELNLANGKQ